MIGVRDYIFYLVAVMAQYLYLLEVFVFLHFEDVIEEIVDAIADDLELGDVEGRQRMEIVVDMLPAGLVYAAQVVEHAHAAGIA